MKPAVEHLGLRDYLNVLSKRRQVVIIVFTVIFGLTVVWTLSSTRLYESTSKIIIERVDSENLTNNRRSQPYDPAFEETQFQLIRSQAVSKRVLKILKIENPEDLIGQAESSSWLDPVKEGFRSIAESTFGWIGSLQQAENEEDGSELTPVDKAALELSRNVKVKPVKSSNITAISFISPDPVLSAQVANAYVDAYLQETLEMKMDATRRNLEWMTEKADAERLKLQATEKKLQDYMEKNDLVTLEDRVAIIPEKLGQLGLDLVRAESKTKEQKLLYDKVTRLGNNQDAVETVLSISEGSSLEVLRAQILKAEQSNMELSNKYGKKHPVMIKAINDLNVLRNKLKDEIRRLTNKIRNQYELALSNENSIKGQLKQTKLEALALNEKYTQYSVLKRELETNRQMQDALLAKIKTQSITGETRPVNVWVVEKAKKSLAPVRPMTKINILLGIVFGLLGGAWCAFLVNRLDNRIKSSEGLFETLGVPVLGSVTFNKNKQEMNEIARTDPRSEFAESYNALRTTLLLSSAEAPPKKILITSSIPGEGKTTTSTNLALTLAKSDSRVLLIDTDLRKPVIHKVFKLRNNEGLSSYLAGSSDRSILRKSPYGNLVVVPAGPIPPNPYELLNSTRMKTLLESLENDFDYIICDSPPIMSVADSRQMSQYFNGLILVARAGVTTYQMAQNSINLLAGINAKMLGVFVNAVRASDQAYYKYYSSYIEDTQKGQKKAQVATKA